MMMTMADDSFEAAGDSFFLRLVLVGLWVLSLLSSFDYSWYFYDGMIEMEGVRAAG